jgi:hypothetical protein
MPLAIVQHRRARVVHPVPGTMDYAPTDRLRVSTPSRRCVMKVMVFVKATKDSEVGRPPDPKTMEAMGKYNEALLAAGILKERILGGLKATRLRSACISQVRTAP